MAQFDPKKFQSLLQTIDKHQIFTKDVSMCLSVCRAVIEHSDIEDAIGATEKAHLLRIIDRLSDNADALLGIERLKSKKRK